MKLSRKSEYAIRALIEMTLHSQKNQQWWQISLIAEATKIPEKYLEQILLSLKNAGLLKSRRGVDGGYALNCKPDEMTLDEILRHIEGAAQSDLVTETGDDLGGVLLEVLSEAQNAARNVLQSKTLAALAAEVQKQRDTGWDFMEYQI